MDSTGASVTGFIPKLMDGIPHNEDGVGGMHLYTPWWLDNKKLDFPRGYHIELGRRPPHAECRLRRRHSQLHQRSTSPARPHAFGGYGKELKDDYRRLYGATVNFAGRGEMIPNDDSYCEIDPNVVDQWGIPVLRFHFKWSDYELNQAKHMQETFRAIITGDGRHADLADADEGRGLRHRARAAASSTRSASRGWATIRRPRC